MKIHSVFLLVALCLILLGIPASGTIAPPQVSPEYVPAQSADLQFTVETMVITVEQGGTNTGTIRIENYGGAAGSANLTYLGEPGALTGMTIELSTMEITDLAAGAYQDIIVTVGAEADLWPLGPRRIDIALHEGSTELDILVLEMEVIAPTNTNTGWGGLLGLTPEVLLLSAVATVVVIGAVVLVRRR